MRKRLEELTIKDGFMFAAVMTDPENCKRFLELILNIPIDHVEIDMEKTLIHNPKSKGVRLDVYAKDEKQTVYDVEMQVNKSNISARSRYYHAHMTVEMLEKGEDYDKLSDGYVIFICDYDPFGYGKYVYTIVQKIKEVPDGQYSDGTYTVFLNTHGSNVGEVNPEIVHLLKYIGGVEEEETSDFVHLLEESVQRIKRDRNMMTRYLSFEEIVRDERAEAKEEGRVEGRAESRSEFTTLLQELVEQNKFDEIKRLANDKEYLDELLKNR